MTTLTHIRVSNYRSLYNFELSLHPFTVLIGRNDAGKSNVLKATRLLLEDGATADVETYDWSRAATTSTYPRYTVVEGTLGGQYPLTIRRRITINKESPASSMLEVLDDPLWRLPTDAEREQIPSFYYLRPRTGALQEAFDPNRENNIFTLIKDWMPPALSEEKDLHKLMRGYAPQGTNLKAYTLFFEEEVYAPLQIAFPSDFPLVTLHPEFRSKIHRGRLFVRELTHSAAKRALFRLPLDRHGTGLISVVAMALSVAVLREYHRQELAGKPLVIAIEEPEVHLHPHAQRTLLKYLKWASAEHQLLVSTHSPIFVDRAQPENVVLVRRTDLRDEKQAQKRGIALKAGTTQAITSDYAGNWSGIIAALGVRLSDALIAGEVNLLVEGPTEAILLPAMAERLTSLGQPSIDFDCVFVVVGEGGNLPHIARLLQGTSNPTVVIVDNDREGHRILEDLDKDVPIVKCVSMPDIRTLPPPLDQLEECEFEDLLDSEALLGAFNEAFTGIPGFDFLPLDYAEFQKEQRRLLGGREPFGWISTVSSLLGKKSTTLANQRAAERVSKHILARKAAQYVRDGKLLVPPFCQQVFAQINELLRI